MNLGATRPAVFLDRDGTLNLPVIRGGKPYPPTTLAEFELFPDAPSACRSLHAAGFVLVVVTNQPDVGRGTQSRAVVESMHAALRDRIPEISHVEVCYDPGQGHLSRRRKPAPGMLFDAADLLHLDLSRSWMIGDRWRDIDCGHQAGVKTIFIDLRHAEALRSTPHFTVSSLAAAATIVLAESNR